MANSYSISRCTWKWMKKLFFHLLCLKIRNNQILLKSYSSKLSLSNFRLVRNIVELAGPQPCPLQTVGRPSALVTRVGCLGKSSHQHWPTTTETRMDCVACYSGTKEMPNSKCQKCNAELCISGCFRDYHTVLGSKLQQWVIGEDFQAQRTAADEVCNNSYIK